MNNADYVANLIKDQKAAGEPLPEVAWNAALACVGWAYVFGARGQYCTPANRRARYSADHPTIKTACKNYEGSGSCSGCKWFPGGKKTRISDCRGFTYWIIKQVFDGFEIMGSGATSQWNDDKNWKEKGEISRMPKDTLVCLFVKKGNTMEHTGFGLNNETIECSSGVQHFTSRKPKWTHYAVPACIDYKPKPEPEPEKGTAIVTGKNLALRQGPGTDCTIRTRMATGTVLKIEQLPEGWTYVSYNGKKGFVMDEFIKKG